jgi:hypothetical protein
MVIVMAMVTGDVADGDGDALIRDGDVVKHTVAWHSMQ